VGEHRQSPVESWEQVLACHGWDDLAARAVAGPPQAPAVAVIEKRAYRALGESGLEALFGIGRPPHCEYGS
jgi:hypothetical protein